MKILNGSFFPAGSVSLFNNKEKIHFPESVLDHEITLFTAFVQPGLIESVRGIIYDTQTSASPLLEWKEDRFGFSFIKKDVQSGDLTLFNFTSRIGTEWYGTWRNGNECGVAICEYGLLASNHIFNPEAVAKMLLK